MEKSVILGFSSYRGHMPRAAGIFLLSFVETYPCCGVQRVETKRKTWKDAASQMGAFVVLDNAKACADEHPGYSVFDSDGKSVYKSAAKKNDDSFMVRVRTDRLNIRSGPGTDHPKTGAFTGKGIFTIVEVQSGKGSEDGWGRLKSGAGWIALDYTERL